MSRALFILAMLCLSARADYQQKDSSITVGPDGVSLSASGQGFDLKAKEAKAQLNFSVMGLLSGNPNPGNGGATVIVVPGNNQQRNQPTNAFTDSETFFKGIGKPAEPDTSWRRRRRTPNGAGPEP